jgi:hypothetical protein
MGLGGNVMRKMDTDKIVIHIGIKEEEKIKCTVTVFI